MRLLQVTALILGFAVFATPGSASRAQDAGSKSKTITVDLGKQTGRIRPLHDVHSGPLAVRGSVDLSEQYRELGFRYIRTHDTPWVYEAAGDMHVIFRNLEADADDPNNYDFSKTDRYIQSLVDLKAEIIFRLGESAELTKVKYYNQPPADYEKWAKVAVNIVRHYNDGWANGHSFDIRYWEVWNEPDLAQFWSGTAEQYYQLYATTAGALKRHNAKLQVGGPALASNDEFLKGFLAYNKQRGVPVDFVSWHNYGIRPYLVAQRANNLRKLVDASGYPKAELHLNEWNYFPGDWSRMHVEPHYTQQIFERIHGPEGAAYAGAMLTFLQDSKVDVANYYTGTAFFWGMYDNLGVPYKNFYPFRAFRWMLDTPLRVQADGAETDIDASFAVLAGLAENRKAATLMISNQVSAHDRYSVQLKNIPWKGATLAEIYRIDGGHDLDSVATVLLKPGEPLPLTDVAAPSVSLVKLRAQ
ncbi:MAG TPA: hypothetical protein VGE08_21755 [Steroidobacter sp.]|uniref:GH39 family glycosyl hydrolase n=1 Tax=Steroidobacter sp. TaxID=1978227 RepID=UPI002ED99F32